MNKRPPESLTTPAPESSTTPERPPESPKKKKIYKSESGESEKMSDIQSEISNKLALQMVDSQIIAQQERRIEKTAELSSVLKPKEKEPFKHLNARERVFLESYSVSPYYVPRNEEDASELDRYAVIEYAPISARLFPDVLFQHLTGGSFKNKKDVVEGLEERARQFDVIREYFISLKAISASFGTKRNLKTSGRMFVSTRGENRGSILITRKPKVSRKAKRRNNYYPDIYTAERAQTHIIQLYSGRYKQNELEGRGELEMLKILRSEFQRTISFLQNWKSATNVEKQEIQTLLQELEERLSADTNLYKEKAKQRLSSAKTLDDKRKKQKNPPAASARLVGAYNDLLKRTEEIFKMMGFVVRDRNFLHVIREYMHTKFEQVRTSLDCFLNDDYFKPFDEIDEPENFLREKAKRINQSIFNPETQRGVIAKLIEIANNPEMPAPFPEWAEAVISNLRVVYKLNRGIEKGTIDPEDLRQTHDDICRYSIKAQLALRYQFLQQQFVEMLEDILQNPDKLSAEKIQNRALEILKSFNPHSVGLPFEKREDLKFVEDSFEEFTKHVNAVVNMTVRWQNEREKLHSENAEIFKNGHGKVNEEILQKLIRNEDMLNQIEREFLDEIYGIVADVDFRRAIESLTVDADKYY